MTYETIKSKARKDFVLCSPRVPQKCPNVRDLYFKAIPGESMIAYEFTTSQAQTCPPTRTFVAKFVSSVLKYGVQDVFVLTALSICPQDKVLTEFEMGHILSTALVPTLVGCRPRIPWRLHLRTGSQPLTTRNRLAALSPVSSNSNARPLEAVVTTTSRAAQLATVPIWAMLLILSLVRRPWTLLSPSTARFFTKGPSHTSSSPMPFN